MSKKTLHLDMYMYAHVYVYTEKSPSSFWEDLDALDYLSCVKIGMNPISFAKEPYKRALYLSGRIWMHLIIFLVQI